MIDQATFRIAMIALNAYTAIVVARIYNRIKS
jgi:hypothetical protein